MEDVSQRHRITAIWSALNNSFSVVPPRCPGSQVMMRSRFRCRLRSGIAFNQGVPINSNPYRLLTCGDVGRHHAI
jgi:hypothetical protein